MAKKQPGQITEKELAQLPENTRNKILSAMAKQDDTTTEERKASMGAEIKSSVTPILQSMSKIEKVQEAAAVEAATVQQGGQAGVLDNILSFSKITADNTSKLITITEEMKLSNEKIAEDNKELLARLLGANESLRKTLEENLRESSRSGTGGIAGAGMADEAGSGAGGGAGGGGGFPDWLKTIAGVAAGGIGAKMLGGASKVVGKKAATRGMAGLKGFKGGMLKGGALGAAGLLAYTMAPEDIKETLAGLGIDENAIAAAGVAGSLGYGAYKARQGMDTADKAIKEGAVEQKVQKIDEAQKSGKQAERIAESKAAKAEKGEPPKKELPPRDEKGRFVSKDGPKVDPTKAAAEAAKDKLAKEAGETVGETAGKKAAKTVGVDAVKKAISKSAASKAVATVAKKIPIVGALVGLSAAVSRAWAGDYPGAAGEVVSGALGATGVGAAPSLAIDAGLLARDVYQDLYGVFPEDDDPELRTDRFNEISSAVTDYAKSLVSQNEDASTQSLQPLDENSGSIAPPPSPDRPFQVSPAPSAPSFKSGASDTIPSDEEVKSMLKPQTSLDVKTNAINQQAQSESKSSPIIVNKGGDTINNITNASKGGSGGAQGSPSRIPNPWDDQVFGKPWAAYF